MAQLPLEFERLMGIFHPFMLREWNRVNNSGIKFVHYTSADTAAKIIKSQQVWMRNISCMNDFSEVEHGLKILVTIWDAPIGQHLRRNLDAIFAGLSEELGFLFGRWSHDIRHNSFLSCFSEQKENEYQYGRLSMWRAYGGTSGVAMIMNNDPFLTPSDALGVYASPVLYADKNEFEARFNEVSNNLEMHREHLRSMERSIVLDRMFNVLRMAVLCTKHPGFLEEREWRVIYTTGLARSDRITQDVEVIRNVPQAVYKIPLRDVPDEGLTGISIAKLIHRILIGPTDYAQAVKHAFIKLLLEQGVADAELKVWTSDIPLR